MTTAGTAPAPPSYGDGVALYTMSSVRIAGFEPATPWSQTRCATKLRYIRVEPSVRIELTTYRLQGGCSATELQGRFNVEVVYAFSNPLRNWGGHAVATHLIPRCVAVEFTISPVERMVIWPAH